MSVPMLCYGGGGEERGKHKKEAGKGREEPMGGIPQRNMREFKA